MLKGNPVAYGSPFSVGYNAQLCFRWRREMPTGRGMRISGNLKVSNTYGLQLQSLTPPNFERKINDSL
jgi:hypothetical protein